MFCRYCGKELLDDAKFCAGCGKKVLKKEESKNTKEESKVLYANTQSFGIYENKTPVNKEKENRTSKKLNNTYAAKEQKSKDDENQKRIEKELEAEREKIRVELEEKQRLMDEKNKKEELKRQEAIKNTEEIKTESVKKAELEKKNVNTKKHTAPKKKKQNKHVFIKLLIYILVAIIIYCLTLYIVDNFDKVKIFFNGGANPTYSYVNSNGEKIAYSEEDEQCRLALKNAKQLYLPKEISISQIAYEKVGDNNYVYIEYKEKENTYVIRMLNAYKDVSTKDIKLVAGPGTDNQAGLQQEKQKKVMELQQKWKNRVNLKFEDIKFIEELVEKID